MTRKSRTRIAIGVLACVTTGGLTGCRRDDTHRSDRGQSRTDADLVRTGVLVRTPPRAHSKCKSVAAVFPRPGRCPEVIPKTDGSWGLARALGAQRCQYLIEMHSAPAQGPPRGIFHLLLGGRCGHLDLAISKQKRWPAGGLHAQDFGLIAQDFGLIGVRPLKLGQSGTGLPALPRVLGREQIGNRPGLLLKHPPRPLTSIHTGHLAIIWNEPGAAYVVSGHPPDSATTLQRTRAIRALRETAIAMHDQRPRPR